MIKTLSNLLKADKEEFVVPKGVQDVIPISMIYEDGIFRHGKDKYSKCFKFSDINYAVASREDKEEMFLLYSELLNTLDVGAITKITINNKRMNRVDFEKNILIPDRLDALQSYRDEYNDMLLEKATGGNSIMQEKYITVSIGMKDYGEACAYFNRIGTEWAGGSYRLVTTILRNEWGFVGSVICDFHTDTYMDSKQMLYAGGDLNLCGDKTLMLQTSGKYDSDPVSPSSVKDANLLRRSAHRLLYCIANSGAMKAKVLGYKPAIWNIGLTIGTIGAGVGLAGWGAWAIVSALKRKPL